MSEPINNAVDLVFPVMGASIPRDHGYALYAALSRILDAPGHSLIHESPRLGIFPIRATPSGDGALLIHDRSALRLRLPAESLPAFLPLAGKSLDLDGHRLRIGVPRVEALIPSAVLASPLVLIKVAHANGPNALTPDLFLAAARRKLDEMRIRALPALQLHPTGPRSGQPRRRIIRVKDQTHAGFAMLIQALTPEESLLLQQSGLGGRRLMGCGLFMPERSGRERNET